jgi:hypothetical protein
MIILNTGIALEDKSLFVEKFSKLLADKLNSQLFGSQMLQLHANFGVDHPPLSSTADDIGQRLDLFAIITQNGSYCKHLDQTMTCNLFNKNFI